MTPPNSPSKELGELLEQVLSDIGGDRRAWRWTEIPQIIILFLLIAALLFVTGFGLYTAIEMMRAGVSAAEIGKVIQVFVTGSSSLLGFVVFKLMTILGTKSKGYLEIERRFTSDINLVRISKGTSDLQAFLKGYYQIK
jgi:hypothetical protein